MRRSISILSALVLASLSAVQVRRQDKPPASNTPAQPPAAPQTAPSAGQAAVTPASQRVLTITVPEPGEKYVRILPSTDSKQPEQLPQAFSDTKTTITFDPSIAGKSPKVAVDDAKTGNTAIVPIPAGDKPIDLHSADFDHVHVVKV